MLHDGCPTAETGSNSVHLCQPFKQQSTNNSPYSLGFDAMTYILRTWQMHNAANAFEQYGIVLYGLTSHSTHCRTFWVWQQLTQWLLITPADHNSIRSKDRYEMDCKITFKKSNSSTGVKWKLKKKVKVHWLHNSNDGGSSNRPTGYAHTNNCLIGIFLRLPDLSQKSTKSAQENL